MSVYCRICGAAGAACGESHQELPLLSSASFHRGDTVTDTGTNEPQELAEYHYWTGYMETTAMMTPKMAEKLGAKPVDEELDPVDAGKNQEANRMASANKDATEHGVVQAAPKARTPKNKSE